MAETVVINFTGKDDISPVAKDVEKSIKDVGTTAEAQGSKFSAMTEIARGAFQSIGGFAVNAAAEIGSNLVGGVTDFFTSAVRGSMDYQNVLKQTEAVIESTGMAAGFSVEQMEEMAYSMSAAAGASLFPDDAILDAQNILATFTQIKGTEFSGATQSALDMAQALGMDASQAAMMMGKALNDPVKGMSALSRSGVSFTEVQKLMVEDMVALGDVAGAQQLILKEMEVQFGGSALKATESLDGAMVLLTEGIEDAKGAIGDTLLPILTRFTNFGITMLVPMLKDVLGAFGDWIASIDWDTIIISIGGMLQGFTGMVSNIDWASLFSSLSVLVDFLMSQMPTAMEIVQPAITNLMSMVRGLIAIFTGPEMQSIAGNVMQVIGVVAQVFGSLISAIAPIIAQIIQSVQSLMPPVATAVQMITDTLTSPSLTKAFNTIADLFSVVGEVAVKLAELVIKELLEAFHTLWPVVNVVITSIGTVINAVIPVVTNVLKALMMYLNGDATGALKKLKETFSTVWNDIKSAVMSAVNDITSRLGAFIGEVSSTAMRLGSDIMSGVARGIASGANAIKDAMRNAVGDAISFAKGILGIASPSKVMAQVVGAPIGQGIAAGIMEGIPAIRGAMAVSLGAAQGQATQSVQNYYLSATYNTAQSESSLRNDLRAMQLLSGAV